jgi:hypothetical protein
MAHLRPKTRFIEPCLGRGLLVEHLTAAGHVCVGRYGLPGQDARLHRYDVPPGADFITNPPWLREILHLIIANLSDQARTWLLIDADWLFTLQAAPYLPRLRAVVAVGRVRWIPDTRDVVKDNCAWCLFDRPQPEATTISFTGKLARSDLQFAP